MKVIQSVQWAETERVISVEPEMNNRVHTEDISLRRLNYFSGRTLTKTAMNVEVEHHNQHLAMFGRQLSDGIVNGLQLSASEVLSDSNSENPTARELWHFTLTPGLGVTYFGDDVMLSALRQVRIADVPTFDTAASTETPPQGIGIVVLQAVKAQDLIVDRNDSCELDEDHFPFEDQIYIDGARLLWYPWPASYAALPSTSDARLRNEVAYKIFTQEKLNPDVRPPWEQVGVALALVNIDVNGAVKFIDRHAVVRQGGSPLSVLPQTKLNGSPFLWQARTDNLTAYIQEMVSQGKSIYPALKQFRYLPPFGVLPKDAMDFSDHTTPFFPSQYRIEAAPIPVEEVEVALEASASLEPFDLHVPDRVKILVPVPQTVYEAELLLTEQVDPVFIQTLKKLVAQVKVERQHRDLHRQMAGAVQGVIDPARIDHYPEPDPEEVPDETDVNVVVEPYVIPANDDQALKATQGLQQLYDWIKENMSFLSIEAIEAFNPNKLSDGSFIGLIELIRQYSNHIKRTNDHLDSGFMQLQSESYRLRQMMLGNEKASRLSTSPALANVVKGALKDPTPTEINQFFINAKQQSKTDNISDDADNKKTSFFKFEKTTSNEVIDDNTSDFKNDGRQKSSLFKTNKNSNKSFAKKLMNDGKEFGSLYQLAEQELPFELPKIKDQYEDVFDKIYSPILPVRTLGLKERVYQSASVQVRNNAVKTKASVYESLLQIPIELSELQIDLDPNLYAIISKQQYQAVIANLNSIVNSEAVNALNVKNSFLNRSSEGSVDAVVKVHVVTENEKSLLHEAEWILLENTINSIIALADKRVQIELNHVDLAFFTRIGILDPDPIDADEADYFSAGIASLENAIATLRLVEQRVGIYELALIEMKQALAEAILNEQQWQNEITSVMDKLAEYRHDLSITRALYEEEKVRVAEINLRRKTTLIHYVKQLIYVRPRMVSSIIDVPDKPLYSEYRNPVPACLNENYEATDELDEMLDLFREIPLKWLLYAKILVMQVNHPDKIKKIMDYAKKRAHLQLMSLQSALQASRPIEFGSIKFGQSINQILMGYQQTRKNIYTARKNIPLNDIQSLSWKESTKKAQQELSLSDLIEAGKGTSKMAKKAIEEMENLEDVAVCLYNRCGQVEPAIRLRWADQISVFDQTPSLQNLSILSAWEKVDFELRRELQTFVDWLFSRIDDTYSDAMLMMSDLVRVCILLASHAPVSSIVSGHIPEPVKGQVGDMLDVNLDKGKVKVGMKAILYKDKKVELEGVVRDINSRAARIEVLTSEQTGFVVPRDTKVKFYRHLRESTRDYEIK